jgi:glycosyltransferase involved in cell wall biosynthesis
VKPLRLAIVTRRFWPLFGGPERLLANLAVELAGRGCEVEVLTARWNQRWPTRISFRGIPVTRIPHAPDGSWGTFRYLLSLGRKLRSETARHDLIYVSSLRQEAAVALRVAGARKPVVLRAELAGTHGDCAWQSKMTHDRLVKRRCQRASAIIAPNEIVEKELLSANYPAAILRELPNGAPLLPPRTAETRASARAVLAETHAALNLPGDAPLALHIGRLSLENGLKTLLVAWRQVLSRRPGACLWLAGEGPDRAALKRQIESLNLAERVLLTGVFDEHDVLLAAADLYVAPAPEPGTSLMLIEAMGAGLPVVAADAAGHRLYLTDEREGLLVPANDALAFTAGIQYILDNRAIADRLGAAARQRVASEHSICKMGEKHLSLFEEIVDQFQRT